VVEALEMLTGGTGSRTATASANWGELKEQVESDDYFVGAGSQQQDDMDVEGQRKKLQGIVTGHAYSVLQVYEGGGLQLVELRKRALPFRAAIPPTVLLPQLQLDRRVKGV
jgi:hypothetical protein